MWDFNPFSFLREDEYSPHSRALRVNGWVIDGLFDALYGSPFFAKQIRVGLFDYCTLMIPRVLEEITWRFVKWDPKIDGWLSLLLDVLRRLLAIVMLIVVSLVITLPKILLCLTLSIIFSPLLAMAQSVLGSNDKEKGEQLKQAAAPLCDDPVLSVDHDKLMITNIQMQCATLTITLQLRTKSTPAENENALAEIEAKINEQYGTDGIKQFKINLLDNDPAWQAFRELNIGRINTLLKQKRNELKDQAKNGIGLFNATHTIAQGIRTKTSFFQNLPTEMIVEILQRAYLTTDDPPFPFSEHQAAITRVLSNAHSVAISN